MRCMQGGQSMQELSRTRFPQGGQTTQVLSRTIYSTSPMLAARRQDTALSMSADKLPSLRPCSAEEQHGVTGEPARRPRRVSLNSPYLSSTGLKHTHLELCPIRIQKHGCDPSSENVCSCSLTNSGEKECDPAFQVYTMVSTLEETKLAGHTKSRHGLL